MDKALQLQIIAKFQDKLSAPLKRISGATGETASSVKVLRDKLKVLEGTQRTVGQFRDLSRGLSQTQAGLQAAEGKVKGLADSIKLTESPTAAMRREFDAAVRAAQKLKNESQQQALALQGLRDRLSAAGISTKSLSSDERILRGDIVKTNQQLDQQRAKLSQVAQQQKRLNEARERYTKTQQLAGSMAVGGAASLGGGYAMLRPVKSILDAFAPLEDSATQLQVSMMTKGGQISDQFKAVSALATRLGDQLPGTTADFQNMMTMLKRQGMSDQTILGGLGEAAANMGVLLKLPVEQAAEFGAKMQDALQAPESEMLKITDGMQRMFYAGVDAGNILDGFSKVAPALSTLGKAGFEAFQEVSPLLAMFDQAGMQGEAAGNALRKVFQRSINIDRIGKANDALKELGVNMQLDFTDGKGEFGGLDKMFAQFERMKGLTSVQRGSVFKELFGEDAETLQVVTTMMTKGMVGYDEMRKKMEDQASLQDRVKAQLETLSNVAEAAGGNFTNALASIGASIAPDLKNILNYLGELANSIGAWAKENPGLTGTIVKVVAVLGILLTVMGALTIGLAAIIGPFAMVRYGLTMFGIQGGGAIGVLTNLGSKVLPLVTGAASALGKVILANPIAAAVAAIAIAALLIWKYWDPIKGFFMGLWEEVKTAFSGGLAGIGQLILNWSPLGLFYQAFAAVMSYFGVELPGKFTEFGSMLVSGLIKGIGNMAGSLKDSVVGMGSSAVGWFKEKLGINSPSRVFVGFGENISEGAAKGIERGQGLADKAAQILAAGVMSAGAMAPSFAQDLPAFKFDNRPSIAAQAPGAGPSAALGAAGMTIGGDHVEIHVHAAPGQSPEDIGKAIAAELDRRERNKMARIRSSLADYGN